MYLPIVVKLASIAVHAEEMITSLEGGDLHGAHFDGEAIKGLLADPDVKACLEDLRVDAMLPLKRSE